MCLLWELWVQTIMCICQRCVLPFHGGWMFHARWWSCLFYGVFTTDILSLCRHNARTWESNMDKAWSIDMNKVLSWWSPAWSEVDWDDVIRALPHLWMDRPACPVIQVWLTSFCGPCCFGLYPTSLYCMFSMPCPVYSWLLTLLAFNSCFVCKWSTQRSIVS